MGRGTLICHFLSFKTISVIKKKKDTTLEISFLKKITMNICFKFHQLSIYLWSCWILHYSEFLLFLVFIQFPLLDPLLMPNFLFVPPCFSSQQSSSYMDSSFGDFIYLMMSAHTYMFLRSHFSYVNNR